MHWWREEAFRVWTAYQQDVYLAHFGLIFSTINIAWNYIKFFLCIPWIPYVIP